MLERHRLFISSDIQEKTDFKSFKASFFFSLTIGSLATIGWNHIWRISLIFTNFATKFHKAVLKDESKMCSKSDSGSLKFTKKIQSHMLQKKSDNAGPPRLAMPSRPRPCLDFAAARLWWGRTVAALPAKNWPWQRWNVLCLRHLYFCSDSFS